MKRWIILSVIAAIILCITSVIGWMVGTSRGNHFVLTTIIKFIPAKIEIGRVTGILTDNLRIDDIRVCFPGWEIRVKTMEVSLQPAYLTAGTVVFKKAIFQDASIVDLNPKAPTDIVWPRVPGWLSWVNGRIKDLSFDRLVIYSKDKENAKTGNFRGEMLWRFGTLTVKNAAIGLPFGKLEGNADAGFVRPALSANIRFTTQKPVGTVENFVVTMKLKQAKNPEHVSGPITVKAISGKKDFLYMNGNIAITNNAIKFKEMLLTENGRQGEALVGGMLDFASYESIFDLYIKLTHVNLSRELTVKTSFSGKMHVKGNPNHYNGDISIKNADNTWKDIYLKSTFEGDSNQVQLNEIDGGFLNGTLKGFMKMSWAQGFSLSAGLKGRGIDPSKIAPDWQGKINTNAVGSFSWPKRKPPEGSVRAEFLNSVLRNKALTGKLDASWQKGILQINAFNARGDGFDLHASGVLAERLTYEARVSNLAGLLPGSQGRLAARGWACWKNEKLSGAIKGRGSSLSAGNARAGAADVEAELDSNGENRIVARVKANDLGYGDFKIGSLMIKVDGKANRHNIRITLHLPDNKVQALFSGSYMNSVWEGNINQLEAVDAIYGSFNLVRPSPLRLSTKHFSIGALTMNGSAAEKLDIDAKLDLKPLRGYVKVRWQDLNIARINPFISKVKLSGSLSGSMENEWLSDNKLRMTGAAEMNGSFISGPVTIKVAKAGASLKWDEKGLDSSGNAAFDGGGSIRTQFSSNQPARMGKPDSGELSGIWKDINTDALKPWLPETLGVKGRLSGKLAGKFLPGSRFEVAGESKMSDGRLIWKKNGGRIAFSIEKADLGFAWKESSLKGNIAFVLPSHGQIEGTFQLPVAASLPVRLNPAGPVRIEGSGKIREKGVVSAVFPGLIEDTRGLAGFRIIASGTWQDPDYKGWLKLEQGGAFLPVAGVHIKDLSLEGELNKDRINFTSFHARSGQGDIQGSVTVRLKDWKIEQYKGKLTGKMFQAVYLPETQLSVNPDLTFEGDMKKLSVQGSVEVPEALISQGEGNKGVTHKSPDATIIDAPQKTKKTLRFNFDARVMVVLGDKVQVKAPGIGARLEGRVLLSGQSMDKIIGDGQIKIVKGQYSGYGTKLDVTRGSIVFSGKPVELASLDIMALRSINTGRFNEIKAGVTITGTPQLPLINLYSEPSMPEADILSYIVLGRPVRVEGETNQSALLLRSAGAFFAGGKTGSLQGKFMQKVGIDTLDVETKTTTGSTTGSITGSSVAGTAGVIPGSIAGSTMGSATLTRSLVTVGKYLAPGLYVAYGRSLFTEEYLITTRYSFTKSFEVESKTGIETGVDLYYKIEFD